MKFGWIFRIEPDIIERARCGERPTGKRNKRAPVEVEMDGNPTRSARWANGGDAMEFGPEREYGGRPNGRAVDKSAAVEGVIPVASCDAVKK